MSISEQTEPLTLKELKTLLESFPEQDLEGIPVLVYHSTGKLLLAPVTMAFYGFNGKLILGRAGDFCSDDQG